MNLYEILSPVVQYTFYDNPWIMYVICTTGFIVCWRHGVYSVVNGSLFEYLMSCFVCGVFGFTMFLATIVHLG